MLRKNTAGQFLHIAGVNVSTGAVVSGATWTMRRCLDGTFAAGGATITEDGTTGFYKVALAQADTNANNLGFFFTATNCVPVTLNAITTACDPTSTAFGLSIAKTTNITGFNDIAATDIVSAGAITTSGGAVSTVTTTTTATNVTTVNGLAAGVITAASIATGAIDADALAADAVAEIADGVWDEAIAGHLTAGSTGAALNAAGSAGDPWSTPIPGAYGAGTAGKIVGDNLNATVSSRASQTSLDTLDDYVDTEVAAIKAKTDNLPAAPAAVGDIPTATQNADALLNRDMSAVSDTNARSPLNALRFLRNKWDVAATTLTVKKEDDATTAWTATVSTNAAADPITGSDPA